MFLFPLRHNRLFFFFPFFLFRPFSLPSSIFIAFLSHLFLDQQSYINFVFASSLALLVTDSTPLFQRSLVMPFPGSAITPLPSPLSFIHSSTHSTSQLPSTTPPRTLMSLFLWYHVSRYSRLPFPINAFLAVSENMPFNHIPADPSFTALLLLTHAVNIHAMPLSLHQPFSTLHWSPPLLFFFCASSLTFFYSLRLPFSLLSLSLSFFLSALFFLPLVLSFSYVVISLTFLSSFTSSSTFI